MDHRDNRGLTLRRILRFQDIHAIRVIGGRTIPRNPDLMLIEPLDQPHSLPDARPRSERFRCDGRESNFLAVNFLAVRHSL